MKTKFVFIDGNIPAANRQLDNMLLFNRLEYLNVWTDIQYLSFYILNKIDKGIEASIHFQLIAKRGYSLYKSPFGSMHISEKVDFETLYNFIEFIESHLGKRGIPELYIKHYPGYYYPGTSGQVSSALGLKGFKVSDIDINHYIEVTNLAFTDIIHPMEFRKLKKCNKAGLIFQEHPGKEAESVFKCIEAFRSIRNIPLNIELGSLLKLVDTFPGRYKFFSVTSGENIIAATVCVLVNEEVLYNFLPAHDENYKSLSPVVFLVQGIYNYAFTESLKFIDLGISSLQGKPQAGLIIFKERLGGQPASKLSFIKEIR